MNSEIQTAYNEWLLKYGFNPVPMQQLEDDNMYHLVLSMHHYKRKPDTLLKRLHIPGKITYQLKTLEEIKDENPTKTP
jgi:hypothetical protein